MVVSFGDMRVVWFGFEAKLEVLDCVFMATEDLGVMRKLSHSVKSPKHLLGIALEEAAATCQKEGVTREKTSL